MEISKTTYPLVTKKPGPLYYSLLYLMFNFFILYIPLNSYFEIKDFLSGNLFSWSEARTPLAIKMIKDCFLLFNVLMILPFAAKIFQARLLPIFWYFIVIILFALTSLLFLPPQIVLMGIRGNWVLIFVLVGFVYEDFDVSKISRILALVFLLHLVLQIIEMIYAPPIFTAKRFGLNVRNPGIFMVPANAGAFSLLAYMIFKSQKWKLLQVLTVFSVLLSNNTTAMLLLIVFWFCIEIRRIKFWYLLTPLFLFLLVLLIFNLGTISGRGVEVYHSFLYRIYVIQAAFSSWTYVFLGRGFGLATSTAVVSGIPGAIIADNTVIGSYCNMGIIGMVSLIALIFVAYRNLELLPLLIFIGFLMTTVIFELNPVIQILLVFLGASMAKRNREQYYLKHNEIFA
jgi:hypothetical protein